MSTPRPPARQRKWAPKVRTGCKSCKVRKKKCDETKPHCLRCLKGKFSCDGYATPKPWVFEPERTEQYDGGAGEAMLTVDLAQSTENASVSPNSRSATTSLIDTTCFEHATSLVSDMTYFEPNTTSLFNVPCFEPVTATHTLLSGSASAEGDCLSLPFDEQEHEQGLQYRNRYESSNAIFMRHGARHTNHSVVTSTTRHATTVAQHLSLMQPSTPWSSELDRNFCQYFLLEFAPLLATTSQWRYFWQAAVPQAAWLNPSINHAVIVVAATYESRRSGIDRTELILHRTNLAIRGFAADSVSPDEALIMCRLFSSIAQCQKDVRTAAMHMTSGQKILKEATRSGKAKSEIMRIMAPTVLALTTDEVGDDEDVGARFSGDKWLAFGVLKDIRARYGRLLHSWTEEQWNGIDAPASGVLSIAWSTLTQAFCSALYPDVVVFGEDDPVAPVWQIRFQLRNAGRLLSLDELDVEFGVLIHDLDCHFGRLDGRLRLSLELKDRLKRLVENYVVQASVVEPRMTAGTFWHQYTHQQCYIERHLERLDHSLPDDLPRLEGGRVSNDDVIAESTGGRVEGPGADFERKKREFYLEHVCHHRSGFVPLPSLRTGWRTG
ncbi:hypothetical protein PV11_00746 [Exophiala sideris]|uniref:Zn(2)-C6 fungal-type domain-containing protein n=1 Tax=Exophiala sideris TaxID=1016849 RepID=A0A0D1W8H9_9EURO|nr:hypothetical protein PV11_00746 [Exophiala sideris]